MSSRTVLVVEDDRAIRRGLVDALRYAGYATVDEFVTHILEKEMLHFEGVKDDKDMRERLKGLGYIS